VKDYFQKLLNESGIEQRRIEFLDPVDPDAVFEVAQSYDIGLALEPGRDKNNQIALSNKIFTYLLAGNAVIFSATPAQKLFYEAHPEIGWLYPCGDVQALAEILNQISKDQSVLMGCKQKALHLAADVYNWETEQVRLLHLVESAVRDA
jgi:glycosyltransferase involved in cell wall biosynthesis